VDLIPGGSFFRLDDRGAGSRASFGTEYPATVSAFWLDRYEITVGRFRQFLGAYATWRPKPGDGANPHVPGSGWQATWTLPATVGDLSQSLAGLACDSGWAPTNVYWWTAAPGPSEHKPIACATWYELFAFCAWDGGRLPTLAEWEFAASGGPEQRVFPWSSPPESTVVDETYAVYSPSSNTPRPGAEDVGTHPRGAARWGTMDLGGNVFEAFLDSTTPPDPSASGACRDCALYGPGSTYFAFQGGAWPGDPTWMDNVAVDISAPARTSRVPSIGARCVHDP
jgi:formylglycine-generating enzyme required for sulfatase activity